MNKMTNTCSQRSHFINHTKNIVMSIQGVQKVGIFDYSLLHVFCLKNILHKMHVLIKTMHVLVKNKDNI